MTLALSLAAFLLAVIEQGQAGGRSTIAWAVILLALAVAGKAAGAL